MQLAAFPTRRFVAILATATLLVTACSSAASSPGWTFGPGQSGGATSAAPSGGPTAATSPTPSATPAPTSTPAASLAFTPGTVAAPRVIKLSADNQLDFTPGLVQAAVGETVTFQIHNTGTAVHEFMVGPLADAFADKKGTPEVADILPDKTGEVTVTFSGKGPFGFACHAPGHFEHGMAGYIQLVGPGAPAVGTKDDPRVVGLNMDDSLKFTPASVQAAKGETIRFVLTNSGKTTHEFAVGPADKVAADEVDGVLVLEKDKLDAGSTNTVEYTFDGPGPYAYGCHEPGHYEAGMKGTVNLGG